MEKKTYIQWTKVGERVPDNSNENWEGQPATPYIPCLVYVAHHDHPNGGVIECIRWNRNLGIWHSVDMMGYIFSPPYVITHFCDRMNKPETEYKHKCPLC